MVLESQEAAKRLDEIAAAQRRSAAHYHNQQASPHLMLWGVIWIVGYTATYFVARLPRGSAVGPWIWPALLVLGTGASFWIGARQSAAGRKQAGKKAATLVAVALFIVALWIVLPPRTNNQAGAFFPLLVAIWYVLQGIWGNSTRIAVLGFALGALTLAGYLFLPQLFLLWMAVFGGGGLILGGLWLRAV